MSERFSDYTKDDIWYSVRFFHSEDNSFLTFFTVSDHCYLPIPLLCRQQKDEYRSFHEDRKWSVQCLRASRGNLSVFDPDRFCFRGLEPFQTEARQVELISRRRFHQSVVFKEQIRQRLYGICDPKRFQVLLTEQPETALRRAQEQAAMDEHEVCNNEEFFRGSSPVTSAYGSNTLSLVQLAKELQEWNTRRRLNEDLQLAVMGFYNGYL
jgi:hypothetical protein